MAEASTSDDVIIIPDTPSPVFSRRTGPVSFMKRQPSVNISKISPIKGSNSASSLSYSPPGGARAFPGQDRFASERAEAVRKKKLKDKISNRLGDNGLSPIKRLSPDKAGFVRSSALLDHRSRSGHDLQSMSSKDSEKTSTVCALKGLKRDLSPNIYSSSNSLYERIKTKQKIQSQSRHIKKASSRYGWPSDSDSSEDEILAGAVDSLSDYKCERKTTNGNTLILKKTSSPSVSPVAPKPLPSKNNGKDAVQLFQDSDDELEYAASGLPHSGSQSSLKHINRQSNKIYTHTSCKTSEKCDTPFSSKPGFSPKISSPSLLSRHKSPLSREKRKEMRKRHDYHGGHSARHPCSTKNRESNNNCNFPISPDLMNLSGMCVSLSGQTGSLGSLSSQSSSRQSNNIDETGSDAFTRRQERKRKHETAISGTQSAKMPKSTGTVKTKASGKNPVAGNSKATPETQNVISVVNQLEKDEEVARQLQAELDREFAMALQNQNESGMMDDPGQESIDEEYRYHSAFGDIGHHRVNSPRRRHRDSRHRDTGPAPSGWHLYDPVRMSRNRDRDEIPRMELEQLIADAATSIHAGLEYEMMMGGGCRRGGRRARGSRAGGILENFMFASPNNSGNDYDALMELGELIGDAKQKGLSKNELQRLPTTVYKADENNANTECHICMCDYENGDSLKILPCFHSYHDQCIDKWIKQNATCPVCRVQIKL